MSIGSDPIECCVRGRFLCVCVTARRCGFREAWAFCVGAPRNFFQPVLGAFPVSVSRREEDRRGLPFPAALRISVRGSCRLFATRPSPEHGRWPDFVRSAPRQGAGGVRRCPFIYASAAGVLAGGFLVPAGFGRKCGSHSTGRKRAACCGPFGPGRCLRRDPRPKRTDRLSRYGRDNVGRARGSGCRKTCRGAVRTLPASRCGR